MKIPFSLPDRFGERRFALLVGCCAALVVVVICVAAALFDASSRDVMPLTATAETAESATPETAETAASPQPANAVPAANTGTVLAQTADAGRSYLDETLFIGDSNTARYLMYADETGQAFTSLNNNIGVVSMGAGAITTLPCEKFKGSSKMYTVPEAVAMLKPKRIIICYGTNNLGGSSTDATAFIASYLQGLQAIQKAWPYCDIIVSAIPPLDKQRENTNLTMTQVDAYNKALVTMCEEKGFKFLNSSEVLRDDATGWAKTDYTLSDGVHLSKVAVTAYFNYVRTHAYVTEDRRPQPLGTIPTPDGVPANLITEDPIAVRGAKVPLEFVATNGGKLSGSTSQLVKKGGTASAVTAVPDEGYVFAGWTASTGGSYSNATLQFTMPTNANAGGVVLTAHFQAQAHEHNYLLVEGTEVAATCLTAGSAKYKCSICGDVIEKDIPALGHDWDEGKQSGDQMVYTCRRCGQTKSETVAHTHNFTTVVSDTPASCTDAEVIVLQCTCGATTTTYGQGALGHDGVTQSDGSVVCSRCGTLLQAAPVITPAPEPTPMSPPPAPESSAPPAKTPQPPAPSEEATPVEPQPSPESPPASESDVPDGGDSGNTEGGNGDTGSSGDDSAAPSTEAPAPAPEAPATEEVPTTEEAPAAEEVPVAEVSPTE